MADPITSFLTAFNSISYTLSVIIFHTELIGLFSTYVNLPFSDGKRYHDKNTKRFISDKEAKNKKVGFLLQFFVFMFLTASSGIDFWLNGIFPLIINNFSNLPNFIINELIKYHCNCATLYMLHIDLLFLLTRALSVVTFLHEA